MKAYNVKSVAGLLGVSPHTLRAWERRYRAVVPERTPSGRRLYSQPEVDRLKLLVSLVNQGHAISAIAHLPDPGLVSLVETSEVAHPDGRELTRHVLRLLEALTSYELTEVSRELEWARMSLSCRDFVLKVVSPLMGEVGNLVAAGKLSIAQEHALSSVVRDQIGQILQLLQNHRAPLNREGKEKIILTTREGDLHEFGILLGAVLCANHGVPAHYLGPNLPVEPLIDAVNRLEARIILLGNSPTPDGEAAFERYVRQLDEKLPPTVEVWIGGQGMLPENPFSPERRWRYLTSLAELDEMLAKPMTTLH